MIYIVNYSGSLNLQVPPEDIIIDTTSHGTEWRSGLSPFHLGPVETYGGHIAQIMENAWQYSKVYPFHADFQGNPTEAYYRWRDCGWSLTRAYRYPMGKGAKPLYSLWGEERLGYIAARKRIYIPLYASAVVKTAAFQKLRELHKIHRNLYLIDFDGYRHDLLKNMSYKNVIECPSKIMGHAFVLAMLLECFINEKGEIC